MAETYLFAKLFSPTTFYSANSLNINPTKHSRYTVYNIMDFLDELVDKLQYHTVVLLLFVLDHHDVAVFKQQCYAPYYSCYKTDLIKTNIA